MKLTKTIVAGLLVLGMGSAFAAEPVALTDTQMDKVSAGGAAAGALAVSIAIGDVAAATKDFTLTTVTQGTGPGYFTATSLSSSTGVAF